MIKNIFIGVLAVSLIASVALGSVWELPKPKTRGINASGEFVAVNSSSNYVVLNRPGQFCSECGGLLGN